VQIDKPLAYWAFCHPNMVSQLQTFTQKRFKTEDVFMTRDEMIDAQKALGTDPAGCPYISIIEQLSGDIISIPPGWPHAVINVQVSYCIYLFILIL
jgi:hypothetical protein